MIVKERFLRRSVITRYYGLTAPGLDSKLGKHGPYEHVSGDGDLSR